MTTQFNLKHGDDDQFDATFRAWKARKALSPSQRSKPTLAELRARLATRRKNDLPREPDQSTDQIEPVRPDAVSESDSRRPDLSALRQIARRIQSSRQLEPQYERSRLQADAAEWLEEVQWNLAMTLTFDDERGVSQSLAERLYGQFLPRLREIVVRQGSRRKIQMAPIIEDSKDQLRNAGITMDGREGTHIHVLLRVRGDDLLKYKDAIARAWKATNRKCGDPKISCPNSNQWYLPIHDGQTRGKLTGYFLKHQGNDSLGLLVQYLHLD